MYILHGRPSRDRRLFCVCKGLNLQKSKKSLYLVKIRKMTKMKNFTTRMIGRKVEVSFDHPHCVIATFQAQAISWACQGQWGTEVVSVLKSEYSIEKLQEKVNDGFNRYYY